MVRRLIAQVAVFAAVLLVGVPAPRQAAAQPSHGNHMGDAARVDMLVGSVMREWRQAWEVNRRVNNPEVRSHLTHAKSLIDQARAERRRGNFGRALVLAEAANARVQRANQLLRGHDLNQAQPQAEQAYREAEEMLSRLQRHGPMGPRGEQVKKLLEQANRASIEGRSNLSRRFAVMALEQGRRAWQESMRARMMAQRSRVLETVVEPLVERASDLAQQQNDERMIRVASRAQEHLSMANQMDEKTLAEQKARLLESAMREAEIVIRTLDQAGYSRHRAERAIAEADAALDRAGEVAGDENDTKAADLIERGRGLVGQAREKLAAGDSDAAETLAEQARRMARSAIRAALGPLDAARVGDALSRTDQMIAQAHGVTSARAKQLLASAQTRQEEARRLLAQGDLVQALAQTRIAARLARRAYDLDGQ